MARKPSSKAKTTKNAAAKKAAKPKRKRLTLKASHAQMGECHRKLARVIEQMMPTMPTGPKEAAADYVAQVNAIED